jgi:hypothetical protein
MSNDNTSPKKLSGQTTSVEGLDDAACSPSFRRVVQIQIAPAIATDGSSYSRDYIYALCDDGTMWTRRIPDGEWNEISGIPLLENETAHLTAEKGTENEK